MYTPNNPRIGFDFEKRRRGAYVVYVSPSVFDKIKDQFLQYFECIDNTRALTEEVVFKNGAWYNMV